MRWREGIGVSVTDRAVVSCGKKNHFQRDPEVVNDFGKGGCKSTRQCHIVVGLGFNTTHFGPPPPLETVKFGW